MLFRSPDEMDRKIFQKIELLFSSETPNINDKGYTYDSMMPDILNKFDKINNAKTPKKKLNYIKEIMSDIINLVKFNEGEDKQVGDDDIKPILYYAFINAHPFKIYTDIQFIKIFLLEECKNDKNLEDFQEMYEHILNDTSPDKSSENPKQTQKNLINE